jgi:multiple antibiotic resistance protein
MELLKAFVSLLALINPLGAIPAFLVLTAHLNEREGAQAIVTAATATAVVISVSALFGEGLLSILGITVPALQVSGGILLFLVAISMFNAQLVPSRTTPEEESEAAARSSIAVVPLTIPLLTGPSTVSTVIIYAGKAGHWYERLWFLPIAAAIGALVWGTFKLAHPISQLAGKTGLNIMTRLMGLLLSALAVEFVVNGIRALVGEWPTA